MVGYEVTELLGRGGMGEVYRGRHLGLDRPVAIKFLRGSLAEDPEFRERFLREARLSARLTHPHVVQVYDTGLDGDRPFLVMELLEGESVQARLKRGALLQEEALAVARQALSALAGAHSLGIIHRDIKPGNIFLCRGGTVKVMDFGIARALDEARLTQTGTQMGTAEYMSPEQVEGQAADARSDLYAMGIVLYEMLTGEAPFAAATPLSVMHQHVTRPAPPLPEWVSPGLRTVVARALAKEPADRYPSAETMTQALEQGSSVSPEQPAAPDARSESSPAKRSVFPDGDTRRTNHRAALILGAVTLVLIGILGAFSQSARNRTRARASTGTMGESTTPVTPVQTGSSGSAPSGGTVILPLSHGKPTGNSDASDTGQATGEHKALETGKTTDGEGSRSRSGFGHGARPTDGTAPKREPGALSGERFIQTRTRRLGAEEIRAWPAADLRYAINEIYARHGYDFANRNLKQQFLQFDWYRQALTPGRRDVSPYLSRIEKQNRALMTRIRDSGRAGG
jgi:serine/threonine protein kinase